MEGFPAGDEHYQVAAEEVTQADTGAEDLAVPEKSHARKPSPESSEEELQWMLRASCYGMGPSHFFPSDGKGVEAAQYVCAGCEVRDECLEYALSHRIEHGVWGGMSERERRRMLKQRKIRDF